MHGGGVDESGRNRRQAKIETERRAFRLRALATQIVGEDFRRFLDAGARHRDRDTIEDELARLGDGGLAHVVRRGGDDLLTEPGGDGH